MLGPIPTLFVQRNVGNDQEVLWEQPTLTIGRDPTNDLVIEHKLASRRHARFEKDDVGFYIRDLESTNGTFVNGQRIQGAYLLRNNDEVWIGDTVIVFRDPEATMKGTPPPVARQRVLEPQEELRVDTKAKEVVLRGLPLDPPLTAKEFQLLDLLYQHKGEVLSKEQIAQGVWDYEVYDYNAIDALVYRLRHRIEADPSNPKYLVTVRGFGYKLMTGDPNA
ncbi:MAG: winged helix-turn-helix domain-containing protein [Chloroflexota bacterium]|nr:winged helix-turn-helix domain-containing protein [Chloroflexota bacterium]PLS82571.1 MAG: transcriptional regulator [Chloroflexota bacterium]